MCVEKWVKRSAEECESFPVQLYDYHITRCPGWQFSTVWDRCNFRTYDNVIECEVTHMSDKVKINVFRHSDGSVWQDGDIGKDGDGFLFKVGEVLTSAGVKDLAVFRFGTAKAQYVLPPGPLTKIDGQSESSVDQTSVDQLRSSAPPADVILVPDDETVDSVTAALRLVSKLGLLKIPRTGWLVIPPNFGHRLLP